LERILGKRTNTNQQRGNEMTLKQFNKLISDWHLSEGLINAFELAIKHERNKAVLSLADIGSQEIRWLNRHGYIVVVDFGRGFAEVEL